MVEYEHIGKMVRKDKKGLWVSTPILPQEFAEKAMTQGDAPLRKRKGLEPQLMIIKKYLGGDNINKFYSQDPGLWSVVRAEAYHDVRELDPDQTTDLACRLIVIAAIDDPRWTNQRDGALELLDRVDFTHANMQKVSDKYAKVVAAQSEQTDPLGSTYTLIEAGSILAPHFHNVRDDVQNIAQAWSVFDKKVQDKKGWQLVRPEAINTITAIRKRISTENIVSLYATMSAREIGECVGLAEDHIESIIARARQRNVPVPEKKSRSTVRQRRLAVISGAAAGRTPAEIAQETGFGIRHIRSDITYLTSIGVDLSGLRDARKPADQDEIIRSVSELFQQGLTNREIKDRLGISFSRVMHTVSNLIAKGEVQPRRSKEIVVLDFGAADNHTSPSTKSPEQQSSDSGVTFDDGSGEEIDINDVELDAQNEHGREY